MALLLEPRPYQTEAIAANLAEHRAGGRGMLNVLATGTGKTLCFAGLYSALEKKVLVVCERQHLVEQQAIALERYTGEPWDIEMGDRRPGGFFHDDVGARGIVASMQSIQQERRLKLYSPYDFDAVIVDEAHHAVKKNAGYAAILDRFSWNSQCLLSGWTAWPVRADKCGFGDYFPKLGPVMLLRDAVDAGWLVEPKQRYVALSEIEWAAIPRNKAGEFDAGELADAMDRTELIEKGVHAALEVVGARPAIWFCASVQHAEHVNDAINKRRGRSVAVHGGSGGRYPPKVKPSLAKRAFGLGHFQHIVGCDALVEGYDEARIAAVVIFRPVRRFGRYLQMIGRGTRLNGLPNDHGSTPEQRRAAIAASCKPDTLVVDIVGASLEHKTRPVDLTDVLVPASGRGRDEVRKKVLAGEDSVVLAECEVWKRLEHDKALRDAVRAARVNYEVLDVSMWEDKPGQTATQRKSVKDGPSWPVVKKLRAAGIETNGLSKKEAERLFAHLKLQEQGRISEAQRELLEKFGENVVGWSQWKATIVLDLIKSRGWRPRGFPLLRECWSMNRSRAGYRCVITEKSPTGSRTHVVGPFFQREQDARRVISQCLENDPSEPEQRTMFHVG